jgi:NAD-dependent dihydropyrimidine dehydrogenase PreA subunit
MSIAGARRSHVVLASGGEGSLNASDRAALARLLLERGLEVSCRSEGDLRSTDDRSHGPGVLVDRAGEGSPASVSFEPGRTDVAALAETIQHACDQPAAASAWKPWFPVIDYSRCTNCMQCLSFCLFDVYGVSPDQKIQVQNQSNCKTECPACSRVCPEVAIMFPKYRHGPINGEAVKTDDVRREAMKVDISALLGGDIYSMLRDRSVKAKSRFSKERDDERALKERQNCLIALKKDLDIPAEVLAALPTPEEILAKADAARQRAQAALRPLTADKR